MTAEEITDAELVDEGFSTEPAATTAALVHAPVTGGLMRPVASLEDVVEAFDQYQQLRKAIILPTDEQRIGRTEFVKKSGWRKMAVVMGVSSELVSRDYDRDERKRIIRAEVCVRAQAPNGRYWDGLGLCDVAERCCPKAWGGICRDQSQKHHHCLDGCDGFIHFTHPQHDIPSTAHTRASNRACSDLFGFGEVSADEVSDDAADEPATDDVVVAIVAAMNGIDDENQRKMVKQRFVELYGMPKDLRGQQIAPARRWIESNGGTFAGDAAPAPAPAALADVGPPGEVGTSGVEADPAAEGPPSEAASVERVGELPAHEQRQDGGPPAPGPLGHNYPPRPSDAGQRQRIGMLVGNLTRTCSECLGRRGAKKNDPPVHDPSCSQLEPTILELEDKPILTQIISGDPDRASTTTLTHDEASLYLAMLRHLENVTLRMAGAGDDRHIEAVTPIGEKFLQTVENARAV